MTSAHIQGQYKPCLLSPLGGAASGCLTLWPKHSKMSLAAEFSWAEPAWLGSLESPYYNNSHRALQSYVRKYVDENVMPHALTWEDQGDCPEQARASFIATGLPLADVPPQYKSRELRSLAGIPTEKLDAFHHLNLVDELARFVGGVDIALAGGANAIGVPPVLNHGTEQQRRRWIPGLCIRETSFCLGITETTGGSDVGNIRTKAVKSPNGKSYTLTGTKKWITGAQWATHMTTAVRTGMPGPGGISLLVVPLSLPGIEIDKIRNSGQNAGGASWVRISDVRVPAENLLGRENAGFKYIMSSFNRERFMMAVICNRKSRTCMSTALQYALNRKTFGQTLISHQIIRHKLVTIGMEVESHWAWLEQIAYHVQLHGWQTDTIAGRVALAKVPGGRILELAAREAQQKWAVWPTRGMVPEEEALLSKSAEICV